MLCYVMLAADRGKGQLGHHHIAWQILIHRTQPVIHPGAQRRIRAQPATGVHMKQRFGMVQRLRRAAAVIAQLISYLRQVLPLRTLSAASIVRAS